jgi:cysteine desulfuration protein SufE
MTTLDEILETFEALDDGEERLRYLMELGRTLPPFPEAERDDAHLVAGCQSRVWLHAWRDGGDLRLAADSDAFIVRGLVAILLALYDARTPADVLSLDARTVFGRLGLESQLSMTRRNGLWSMIDRIRQHAARLA